MLYQVGAVQLDVYPVNVNEITHKVGADFASHDVIGAPKPLEFTGPADETLSLSGQLVTHRHIGALEGLDALKTMARSGEPQMVMRGDGKCFGWMAIKSVEGKETYLDGSGVGRIIAVTVELQVAPDGPSNGAMDGMLGAFASLFG